ncbi:transcription factor RfeD, putative, partial [Trichophyton verrucosum HKI 0517]
QQQQLQAREKDVEHPAATTAAVALAQLQQHHRLDWDSEPVLSCPSPLLSLSLSHSPSLHLSLSRPSRLFDFEPMDANCRSSTLPPINRNQKIQRSRKGSLTHSHPARKAKHDRNRSKDFKDFRDITRRRSLNERKALSAEPQTAAAWVQGKRWEDLIEAATSATEVDDRDITPVPQSPPPTSSSSFQPHSPSFNSLASIKHRSSVPPAFQSPPTSNQNSTSITSQPAAATSHPLQPTPYTASPLQKSQTPPPFHRDRDTDLEPFPSIESSMDVTKPYLSPPRPVTSYPQQQHNIYPHPHPHAHHPLHPLHPRHRLSNPAPFTSTSASSSTSNVSISRDKDLHIHIYCASCSRPKAIRDCFACTECICGVCRDCVPALSLSMHSSAGSPPSSSSTVGAMGISVLNLGPTSSPRSGGSSAVNRLARSNSTNTTMSNHSSIHANGKHDGRQGHGCPRCGVVGGKWRAFQLDFR